LSRDEFNSAMTDQRVERPLEENSPGGMGGPAGLPDPEAMFARLDANRDGKVSLSEVPEEGRERFQTLLTRGDKDGDGALTKVEMTAAIQAMAKDLKAAANPARDPREMFKYLDTNGDGKVSTDEVPEGRREGFEKLQARFDKDGDGKLNEEEFVTGMRVVQAMTGKPGEPSPDAPASKPPAAKETAGSTEAKGLPGRLGKAKNADKLIERIMAMDRNNDGKISREEFRGQDKDRFDKIDANQDGFLDEVEVKAAINRLKESLQSGRDRQDKRKKATT